MKKTPVYLLLSMFVVVFGLAYLYSDWSNIFEKYTLPKHPGVERLGANFSFPHAYKIALENEKSALFLGIDWRPGANFYRYNVDSHKLDLVFSDFRSMNFQLSPDKSLVGFTGWLFQNVNDGKLWVSTMNGTPSMVGEQSLGKYNLSFLGWSYDGKALEIYYKCKPNIQCIGMVDLKTQEVKEIYEFGIENHPISNFEWIKPDQFIFDTGKDVAIFDINKKELETFPLKYLRASSLKRLRSRDWLVGIGDPSGTGERQLVFISSDYRCIKSPFKELTTISSIDMFETPDDIKILLKDDGGLLYLMSLKAALKTINMDQLFICNN